MHMGSHCCHACNISKCCHYLVNDPPPPVLQRENVPHYFSGTACCFHRKCPVSFLLCLTPLTRTWLAWVPRLVPLSCYSLFQRVSVILTLKTFKAHLTPTMVLTLCAVPCPCILLFLFFQYPTRFPGSNLLCLSFQILLWLKRNQCSINPHLENNRVTKVFL